MKQSNANTLLPEELLFEIQQYVQGKSLYIPKLKSKYKKWGDSTQSKALTLTRNNEIRSLFCGGSTIDELAGQYSLSLESIKKIVYCKS
jgi:Mor family transcriptional regulator